MIQIVKPFKATRSELVILRAANRAELASQVEELARHASASASDELSEVHWFATDSTGGEDCCIAIVADSASDLVRKLRRAASQVADVGRRRINDPGGVYFDDEQLGRAGKVAILFPGEGSQYPQALTDLAEDFPELAPLLAWHPAGHADIWDMLPAISMVLTSDMALFRVLERLGLRPDVVAGHSTGEIAALMASGMILQSSEHDVGELLDDLSVEAGPEVLRAMPSVKLIAMGADGATAESVIAGIEPLMRIAMHNCPHQTVVVGNEDSATVAIERMREQGIVFEVLPFDRPYHTELCAPLSDAVRASYEKWIVAPPKTPIYSCVASRLFPADLDEARALAADQWTSRVEFPRTIEALYADGVRIFVESGPRGNLSAFVADILKGRPHAAIPANVVQRSGPDQLLHLMARLAAHAVPFVIPEPIGARQPVAAPPDDDPELSALMSSHLRFMRRFYDVQQRVMVAYLAKESTRSSDLAAAQEYTRPAELPRLDVAAASHILPLIGTIVSYSPGKELTALRDFNVDDDIFLRDHTFGREVSDHDLSLTGLPIVPLTVSIEMMAEAGSLLLPGMSLIAVNHIRALRWATSDTGRFTLRVEARLSPSSPASIDVAIHEHDSVPRESSEQGSLLADATVSFAPAAPEAPPIRQFDGIPSQADVDREVVYREMMFHGSSFQGFRRLEVIADDGAEALLEVLPRNQLILSNPAPRFLTDPMLLDAAGQVLGVWMRHHGCAFPMAFPLAIESVELFQFPLDPGKVARCILSDAKLADSQVTGDLDILSPDGRLWGRISGWDSRRFDVPGFYTRHWFSPSEYLLCERWPEAEALAGAAGDPVAFRISAELFPPGYFEAFGGVWLRSLALTVLSRREREVWRSLKGTDRRRVEWLLGRSAAKDAVRSYLKQQFGLTVTPADVEIETDHSGQPRAGGAWASQVDVIPRLSISHAAGTAAAIVAGGSTGAIGLDIEHVSNLNDDVLAGGFTADELQIIAGFGPDQGPEWQLRVWCAKEAAAKALGGGSRHGPRRMTAERISPGGKVEIAVASPPSSHESQAGRPRLRILTGYDGEFGFAICSMTTSMRQELYDRNEQFA